MNLKAVISDPRVMGIIKECGGKMYMAEKRWAQALEELYESFQYYSDSGNFQAKNILIYVILAGMLCSSEMNHADTREAKVYKDDKQVKAISDLRSAFENDDIKTILKILKDKNNDIFKDQELAQYLDDLLRNIRLKCIQKKVQPYRRVHLEFLAREINIEVRDVK